MPAQHPKASRRWPKWAGTDDACYKRSTVGKCFTKEDKLRIQFTKLNRKTLHESKRGLKALWRGGPGVSRIA